ncbi:uncharacterized protein LOC111268354 isoform X2 [Varroa jacobsoni]|uniref:uncharacterized protein LOC111268354 isoform X2 n=1 Tax=Varroa jacobsoni TaxID=62625 RepID=UPI000BF90F1A|nr:uncharacterized protein LOC111268354 isoform X2 [Varroa jacobsoni]
MNEIFPYELSHRSSVPSLRPSVINIGVQPLSHGHGIKLGMDAVIKTRRHPKKTTHHHHHHYDEEEEVVEEHVVDHHRTGEAKQSSRPRPRISFEIGRPRALSSGGLKVIDAPKINKRKKIVPKDYDELEIEEKRTYRKKPVGEYVKAASSGKYKSYAKENADPYIRSTGSYSYNAKTVTKDNRIGDPSEDEHVALGSGPIADYERRSFHSAGSMTHDEEE